MAIGRIRRNPLTDADGSQVHDNHWAEEARASCGRDVDSQGWRCIIPRMVSRGDETESTNHFEARLRATLDVIPAYTWYAVPSGALTFVNERTANYLGLPNDHPLRFGLLSDAAWDSHIPLLHAEDHEETRNVWSTCLQTGCAGEVNFRVRNVEGRYRWFLSRAEPLRADDGTLLYWVGVNLDIEELKQAERYLAEGQRLAHMGSWAFNTTGFSYWSPQLFRIHGLGPNSKAPTVQEYLDLVHPESREFVVQTIQKMLVDHGGFDFTKRILRPDGKIRSVRCVGAPAMGEETFFEFVGTGIDVTEQEQLTEERRRSEAYLAEAQSLSHTGSFGWKPDTGENVWSEETYRIFEYPRNIKPTIDMALQRIHSEDRSRAEDIIESASKAGTDFEDECRLVMPGGAIKHIYVRAHNVHDSSGNAEYIGAVTDITERKIGEEKIREREMELRQMWELVPQLVAVFGPDRERIYANRMGLDYLGISLEEWRQTGDIRRFAYPDDGDRARACFDRARSTGNPFELELRIRKCDGSYRWFLGRYNPLRDNLGHVVRWYVAFTDIEDRKQAEDSLRRENAALREEIDKASMFEEIVGASPALQAVLSLISKVAPINSTVLITGETGTGKELVARAIHKRSTRAGYPFVSVNCAAIPRDLIPSELFGHEKGAFTGATQRRIGRFELAHNGTIFLDEVGELSSDTQIALLRVLQEREIERVGAAQPTRVDVRVIAATNRDLKSAVAAGIFRQDLFYRLNVFPIEVPALRERKEDILMLVEYFMHRYAAKAGKRFESIDKKTLQLLHSYKWPGNIRELQNVIERSVILSSDRILSFDETWFSKDPLMRLPREESTYSIKDEDVTIGEREIIEAALASSRGRVAGPSGAAVKLRVPPSTLDHRIKALKIDKRRFKFL
jgi:PAS domain S-box-containing protein